MKRCVGHTVTLASASLLDCMGRDDPDPAHASCLLGRDGLCVLQVERWRAAAQRAEAQAALEAAARKEAEDSAAAWRRHAASAEVAVQKVIDDLRQQVSEEELAKTAALDRVEQEVGSGVGIAVLG